MHTSTKLLLYLATLLAIFSVTQGGWTKQTLAKPYDRRSIVIGFNVTSCATLTVRATRSTFLRMKRIDVIQWQLNPFGYSWLFGPDYRLNYYERSALSVAQFSFRAIFRSLVEFFDANGDGVYDLGDHIFQEIPFWGRRPASQCLSSSYTQLDPNDPQSIVWTVTEQIDLPGNGYFNISLDFTSEDATDGTILLTPNSDKVDLICVNFPWRNSSSSLALKTYISAKGRTRDAQSNYDPSNPNTPVNKPGFVISGDSVVSHGFFTWESNIYHGNASGVVFKVKVSKTLTADNITIDIDKGETLSMVLFTLATSPTNYIYWDPYVGVDEEVITLPIPSWGILLLVLAGVAFVVTIVILMFYYKRRAPYSYNKV